MDVSFAFGMRAKKFEPKFLPWFVLNDCIQNEEGGGATVVSYVKNVQPNCC